MPIADPGETFDLYVVFTGSGMDLDEFQFFGLACSATARRS